ncbi:hypothetical protein CDL12_20663 [Handroanthus impetiginosus]|uniref:Zinc finger GRF-type domain-containing protein n=1 Tax=Handroanthus impetiginosus TaxID=429701 RepID=A0A2G9GNB7_9LAMI|nr:hypothetical protein CDL12_20663 [Handroanthus impetiginosus]
MKTSWTYLNPGRRYSICSNFREARGCSFFSWMDPPVCERSRQIIPGLLRRVNKLENEVTKFEKEVGRRRSTEHPDK